MSWKARVQRTWGWRVKKCSRLVLINWIDVSFNQPWSSHIKKSGIIAVAIENQFHPQFISFPWEMDEFSKKKLKTPSNCQKTTKTGFNIAPQIYTKMLLFRREALNRARSGFPNFCKLDQILIIFNCTWSSGPSLTPPLIFCCQHYPHRFCVPSFCNVFMWSRGLAIGQYHLSKESLNTIAFKDEKMDAN